MITQQELMKLLTYDPETGIFTWNVDRTRAKSGDRAGNVTNRNYWTICVNYKRYQAHRLAFLYMTGTCPKIIDHIDHNTLNNAWNNLREATHSQNLHNQTRKKSKTGFKGVWRERGAFRSYIEINKRRIHVGTFKCPIDAACAYNHTGRTHVKEFFCPSTLIWPYIIF